MPSSGARVRKLQSSPGPGPSPGSEELDDDEMAELDASAELGTTRSALVGLTVASILILPALN